GLEAGPRLDKADFLAHDDEISGYILHWDGEPKFNKEIPTWRPNANSPIQPLPIPPINMGNMVGGTSVHYGTQSWRFRADDFKVRSTTVKRYGEAMLPKDTTLVDWPLSYEDLEPYYDNVERLIGVSGQGGSNPFASPRARDYPMPPLAPFGYGEMARQGMLKRDYHPFPQPTAIISQDYDGRPACTLCGFCGYFGCWNDSKSSTLVSAIRHAEETGKLDIRPNSRVTKILSNDKGQITGVEYLDDRGQKQMQPAGVVILNTYVYENVRLLLLSTSDYYKNGLANNSGQVGKNYMSHAYVSRAGLFPGKALNLWSGTTGQAVAMDDLNGDHFDHTGLGFIRGAVIFASNGDLPIGKSRSVAPGVPQWGAAYKRWLHENADSVGEVFAQVEPLPYTTNFLDLDPNKKDPIGMPVIRVTYEFKENENTATTYIDGKLAELIRAMGATESWPGFPARTPVPVNSHAYGGTRMGDDPATSVVDKHGLAHEAPNLMVLGGSDFPASSGYNPTETIEAHAWFAAEHLAKHLNDIAV
ncbi:MAG: GMC family oxidoreductase, partial [Thermomicrobiales bacterium]|nr:GMC family oxidoreductase [Thermomicrobiales bacterium]